MSATITSASLRDPAGGRVIARQPYSIELTYEELEANKGVRLEFWFSTDGQVDENDRAADTGIINTVSGNNRELTLVYQFFQAPVLPNGSYNIIVKSYEILPGGATGNLIQTFSAGQASYGEVGAGEQSFWLIEPEAGDEPTQTPHLLQRKSVDDPIGTLQDVFGDVTIVREINGIETVIPVSNGTVVFRSDIIQYTDANIVWEFPDGGGTHLVGTGALNLEEVVTQYETDDVPLPQNAKFPFVRDIIIKTNEILELIPKAPPGGPTPGYGGTGLRGSLDLAERGIAASPAILTTVFEVPLNPFVVEFDFAFFDIDASIELLIDDVPLFSATADAETLSRGNHAVVDVDDLSLFQTGPVSFEIRIDGPAGASAVVDNIVAPNLINGDFANGSANWFTNGEGHFELVGFIGEASDTPEFVAIGPFPFAGDLEKNAVIGDIGAVLPGGDVADEGVSYFLLFAGTDRNGDGILPFDIDSETGIISVNDVEDILLSPTDSFNLQVMAIDDGGKFTIEEFDVNIATIPQIDTLNLSVDSVMENVAPGEELGFFNIVAPLAAPYLAYLDVAITGSAAVEFELNENGALVQKHDAELDHEQRTEVSIPLQLSFLGRSVFEKTLVLSIDNMPISDITLLSGGTVRENATADTVVATFEASENPVEPTAVFSIVSGGDGQFYLDGNELKVSPGATFDFDDQSNYFITLSATDGNGPAYEESFDIFVQKAGPILGTPDEDTLDGTSLDDEILALESDDTINASFGDDDIDGGPGTDTVVYARGRNQITHDWQNDGTIVVTRTALGEGTDTLTNVERIDLDDGSLLYDVGTPNLGFGYRIYQASFDRTPDEGGVLFWIGVLDDLDNQGWSHYEKEQFLASQFIQSDEFKALFGANPTNEQYIDAMYQNVLDRLPDQGGYDFWVGGMVNDGLTREDILIAFTKSDENVDRTAPDLDDGVWVV